MVANDGKGQVSVRQFKYAFINTDHLFRQIKQLLKDTVSGAYTREECATGLRALADRVEQKEYLDQFTLDEVLEHVQSHTAPNRRR